MATQKTTKQWVAPVAICISLLIIGVATMDENWMKIEKENNAFAKDCNDRGGKALFEMNARQCIGAKIPSTQTASN